MDHEYHSLLLDCFVSKNSKQILSKFDDQCSEPFISRLVMCSCTFCSVTDEIVTCVSVTVCLFYSSLLSTEYVEIKKEKEKKGRVFSSIHTTHSLKALRHMDHTVLPANYVMLFFPSYVFTRWRHP